MTPADHPAHGHPRCVQPDCGQPAAASACWNVSGHGPAIVAVHPLHPGTPWTWPVCLDHAHHAIDLMLLRALPEPATTEERP